jgi:sugar lactone lactonase YvrE
MSEAEPAVVSVGSLRFAWREWDARALGEAVEWTHPGLTVLGDGSVATFDQTRREIVRLDGDGRVTGRTPVGAACAHGLTSTADDVVWVADTGVRVRVVNGEVVRDEAPGRVFAVDREGREVAALARPDHPLYAGGPFVPTSVAVDDAADAGSGDVWVADGYGQALVHRYASDGRHLVTLDGEEGGGRFARAHCVFVDRRRSEPRLLVTDRSNHRLAAYDLDGRFMRLIGVGELRMPSAFAVAGDLLFVAELWSRISVYDPDDRLVGHLGQGEEAWTEDGWPNVQGAAGVARRGVRPGRFNAPHGFDAGPDGRLYVAEWSLGGRIVELTPLP